METFKLKKKVLIDGVETDEIKYDLEKITPKDLQFVEKEFTKGGNVATVLNFNETYNAMIFAQAAGIAFGDMQRLSAKDYKRAANEVLTFFLVDSEDTSQQTLSDK